MTREGSSSPETPALAVEASGLGYRYRDGTRALHHLDLEVRAGEVFGLLGPNGSGKSTLLRLAASGAPPSDGAIRLFPDEPEAARGARRRRVAVVFERPPFQESLDGRENALALRSLRGPASPEMEASVDHWLSHFGLGGEAGRPVAAYSLGMRQRLALVEAFSSGAALLLLDEPLLGLDPEGRRTLADALADLRARCATAIVSLHDTTFAARLCDRIAFLHAGERVGLGSPAELVRGLARETVFEVEIESGAPRRPPDGVRILGREGKRLRLASAAGASTLPIVARWLLDVGVGVREIRVREPDLEDVFFELTGSSLETERAPRSLGDPRVA